MVNKISDDGAAYYGPYGSRSMTQDIMEAVRLALKLPNCKKQFPRDIGKDRPCLHYHMNQCSGWCQPNRGYAEYLQRIEEAKQLFSGEYKKLSQGIKKQMLEASENLDFELAAILRDRLNAVESLGQKQLVTAGTLADTDVIGYAQTEVVACFTVLHFSGGNLLDKDYEVFAVPDEPEAAVSSLLKQYYLSRGLAPKVVLLPFEIEDSELFAQLLEQQSGRKTRIRVPQRGDAAHLVELAIKNAREEAERISSKEEKISGTLRLLGKMLSMDPPKRIESFDISNISGTDIVASMVVFEAGKPKRSDYKRFKLNDLTDQNDYESMHQVVSRRFTHFVSQDKGFSDFPDLLLIDGGIAHAKTAQVALRSLNLETRILGMVKDDRHRTRALVTPEGEEIGIDTQPAVFAFIGSIQEETHRFAITYHRQLRSKRLKYSELDSIAGIGPKRKQLLLKTFGSISAISAATLPELERLIPADAAFSVFKHFHMDE